jgi:organic hydroperoxide reductase OsmC/OhrA
MSEHKASLQWSRGGTDFTYKTYPRNHTWRFEGGAEVAASAAPQFLGDASRVDPESTLVAALSSCHLLTFLAIAANSGFVVDSYEDDPVGHLEKNANGKLAVTRVILRPKIVFSGAKQPSAPELEKLHDKAHRECFIANSVLTTVTVEPAA